MCIKAAKKCEIWGNLYLSMLLFNFVPVLAMEDAIGASKLQRNVQKYVGIYDICQYFV